MRFIKQNIVWGAVAAAMGMSNYVIAEDAAVPAIAAADQADQAHMQMPKNHGHQGAAAAGHDKPHWGYVGDEAPERWGGLSEEWKLCSQGMQQSPIDISTATVTTLSDISVHYQPAPLSVVNNGHTIQVNYAPGSYINVAGKRYDLLQFHFHSPSEHTIGGKRFDMVAHLVHKNTEGKLGVIGVKMETGDSHPAIKTVFDNLPKSAGDKVEKTDVTINAADLLPGDLRYFNYVGSLTTPPCSEGVNWMVLATPVKVSAEQVNTFRTLFPISARPVQPVNGRVVTLDN